MSARPTPQEIAKASAGVYRFLAQNPNHELRDELEVLMRARVPPTDEEIADFAAEHYKTHNLGAPSIRTREEMLRLMHEVETRVGGMRAIVRHFLGGP